MAFLFFELTFAGFVEKYIKHVQNFQFRSYLDNVDAFFLHHVFS
jgi:hypothetical protein